MEKKVIRIIDANGNRAREGLRVCEDVARFVLEEESLARELKETRHRIGEVISALPIPEKDLLSSRESEQDFGQKESYESNSRPHLLGGIVLSNLRRSQEACRVLEEITLLLDNHASKKFKKSRFDLYHFERRMMEMLTGNLRDRSSTLLSSLCLIAITDITYAKGRSQEEMMGAAIAGGATMVQLRDEKSTTREVIELAQRLKLISRGFQIPVIINDRVDVALAVEADGVHLGEGDMDLETARRLLGKNRTLGISVRSVRQAKEAEERGANYIAVGSIFPSRTKNEAKVVGLSTLQSVKRAVHIPVVAIGGINLKNLPQVLEKGAEGVAIIQSLLETDNIEERARKFKSIICNHKISTEKKNL